MPETESYHFDGAVFAGAQRAVSALQPLQLRSASGTLMGLQPEALLRVLPGRRLVFRARQDTTGRRIVLKWLVGTKATRDAQREFRGSALLRSADLQTPTLLARWRVSGTDGHTAEVLAFAFIEGAAPLAGDGKPAETSVPVPWERLVQDLARLHASGAEHGDLHFGNLLRDAAGDIWWIDGARVRARRAPWLLPSKRQFARLCSQDRLPVPAAELSVLWQRYCAVRGWAADGDVVQLTAATRRARARAYLRKTERSCSAVEKRAHVGGTLLLNRYCLPDLDSQRAFGDWLENLPEIFRDAPRLKAGNTATVISTTWRDAELVVKRYNNRSLWHRLRRVLRPDRGLVSWRFGLLLELFDLPTARPWALLRSTAAGPTYLVLQRLKGPTVGELPPAQAANYRSAGLALLERLAAEGLVHGDLKATNLVSVEGQSGSTLTLLDLDAMRLPRTQRRRRSGAARDRARWLRNFNNGVTVDDAGNDAASV